MPERPPPGSEMAAVPSFVAEVLATVGEHKKEDLSQRIGQLQERIDSIKSDVHRNLSSYYQDFYPDLAITQELSGRVSAVSSEMKALTDKMEKEIHGQLVTTNHEYAAFSQRVEQMDSVLGILNTLVECHESLESAKRLLSTGNFVECAEKLDGLKQLLEENKREDIKILQALHVELTVQNENLIYHLGERWREILTLDFPTDDQSTTNVHDNVTLTIDKSNTKDLLRAMHRLKILDNKLRHFAVKMMEYIFEPVVKTSSTVAVKKKVTTSSLTVERKEGKSIPSDTFERLVQVLEFVDKGFLNVELDDTTGMKIFGSHLARPLIDCIVEDCLAVAVPTSQKDLDSFAKTVRATEKFQKVLAKYGIEDESESLVKYVSNINTLFANKKCQITLEKARELMTSEIHNMVKVTQATQEPPQDEKKPKGKETKKEDGKSQGLSPNIMKFPDCYISTSVQELMNMAYEILAEASTSEEKCGMQLFYCVRNMFELYMVVVPTYHKRNLEELPQLAALYHNNCMYIAHHLMTLGHQFRKEPTHSITFLDQVQKIRQQGTECYMAQMRRQRDQINEFLALADGFISISEPSHNQSAERAIKQIFFQLNRLQNVWQEVLVQSVYWKSMGTLLNSVLDEVMRHVINLDDISSDDAEQLHGLVSRIIDQSPALFNKDTSDLSLVVKYVPQWLKFAEFKMVLNARLAEIAERWANGKGPLAAQFKPNEIKQLIRALFQNTEVRANVLAQI